MEEKMPELPSQISTEDLLLLQLRDERVARLEAQAEILALRAGVQARERDDFRRQISGRYKVRERDIINLQTGAITRVEEPKP